MRGRTTPMTQYRLRGFMGLVAVIALAMALGAYLERLKHAASPTVTKPVPVAAKGRTFTFFIGAFW